jgi:molybdopterin molybdotransferase
LLLHPAQENFPVTDPCASPGLLSVADALARLLGAAEPVRETEEVALAASLGRVLACDVFSAVDVPPADNSAMDGYALCLADLLAAADHTLPVSQRIAAGHVPQALQRGTAARIFTGAEIPAGADVVVMQEDCVADGTQVRVNGDEIERLTCGTNVRPQGQDMRAGSLVLAAGTRLGPAQLGVAAAAGCARLTVFRRISVAIFSTGDELLEPGEPALPGRIYNSNRYALHGYLATLGCDVIDLGRVPDQREQTCAALQEAAARADLVITTGGASVGEEDHLGAALRTTGQVDLWKIAIKPGKPLLFGHVDAAGGRAVPVLGLPGNPVSVAVTFLVFALPFLRRCQGVLNVRPVSVPVPAAFAIRKAGKRAEYLRVRMAAGRLERFDNQSSGVLTSVAWADGLAVVPVDTVFEAGQPLEYFSFASLLSGV